MTSHSFTPIILLTSQASNIFCEKIVLNTWKVKEIVQPKRNILSSFPNLYNFLFVQNTKEEIMNVGNQTVLVTSIIRTKKLQINKH